MTGSVAVETMVDMKLTQRRFKKHMVEKKRRNRINYALEQLKAIVLIDLGKDVSFIQLIVYLLCIFLWYYYLLV